MLLTPPPLKQEALDGIEFITGPPDSPWGAVRATMGHREPWRLDYLAIGNEVRWGWLVLGEGRRQPADAGCWRVAAGRWLGRWGRSHLSRQSSPPILQTLPPALPDCCRAVGCPGTPPTPATSPSTVSKWSIGRCGWILS